MKCIINSTDEMGTIASGRWNFRRRAKIRWWQMAAVLSERTMLAICGVACGFSVARSEPGESPDDLAMMPAVALLFHGPYNERPYKLASTSSGALTLEEFGDRPIRFSVRRVSGKQCVFLATQERNASLDVEQLDFTKFDGTYQFWEACGSVGAASEKNCTYSLHFNSRTGGYCQYAFQNPQFDLGDIQFPAEACRPFGLGGRGKEFYSKYVTAFEYIHKRCGGIQ